jgi:hypothetical protein
VMFVNFSMEVLDACRNVVVEVVSTRVTRVSLVSGLETVGCF